MGLSVVAYSFLILAFTWSIFWFVGVGNAFGSNQTFVVFLCLFSFYWVHQVLHNTVHVTVTGVIGSWWFAPATTSDEQAPSCGYGSAIDGSLYRAMTYSFGSICFGSFLVAFIQTLRALENSERRKDSNLLLCIIQCAIACILACLQSIVEVSMHLSSSLSKDAVAKRMGALAAPFT
jgi:Plasma-membrane choline transporter